MGPSGPSAGRREGTARRRADARAARVAAGAEELARHLVDHVHHGLAGTTPAWEDIAARMIDAQAPGLASMIRDIGAGGPAGEERPGRMLADHAELWLLLRAHEQLADLPAPLAATVRARLGWTVDTAALLRRAAEDGAVVRDEWLVLGTRDSAEERVTTRRTWLRGSATGRTALVLSHTGPGQTPAPALPVGASITADVVFHDAAAPLRAVIGRNHGEPEAAGEPEGVGVGEAVDAYAEALCGEPWLRAWPVVLAGAVPLPGAAGWTIAGPDGLWLPMDRARTTDDTWWRLAALSGGAGLTVFGEYGPHGFAPVTAWQDGQAVPL
jgi:hypothetical protein